LKPALSRQETIINNEILSIKLKINAHFPDKFRILMDADNISLNDLLEAFE